MLLPPPRVTISFESVVTPPARVTEPMEVEVANVFVVLTQNATKAPEPKVAPFAVAMVDLIPLL
jgi:hypothetical protein